MKNVLFVIFFNLLCTILFAQDQPLIATLVNNSPVQLSKKVNAIELDDEIIFSAKNEKTKKELLINGYTILYFTQANSKGGKQKAKFGEERKLRVDKSQKKIVVKMKHILHSQQDSINSSKLFKVEIQLGKLYEKTKTSQREVKLHSAERSFEFLIKG